MGRQKRFPGAGLKQENWKYLQCPGRFFEGVREEPKRILLVKYLSEEPIKRKSRKRDHPQH